MYQNFPNQNKNEQKLEIKTKGHLQGDILVEDFRLIKDLVFEESVNLN